MNTQSIIIKGQNLTLFPERCVYWEEEDILLIADIHLGKALHFRKSGIPVPNGVADKNIEVLDKVLERLKPQRVLLLGDLFHAQYNTEWKNFQRLRQKYSSIHFELVPGNHDILDQEVYHQSNITIHPLELTIPPFVFTHDHISDRHKNYNISGHIHPAIILKGNGKQRLRLPCFYFGKEKGLLPAFGQFTGMYVIQPKVNDYVFAIANEGVFKL